MKMCDVIQINKHAHVDEKVEVHDNSLKLNEIIGICLVVVIATIFCTFMWFYNPPMN